MSVKSGPLPQVLLRNSRKAHGLDPLGGQPPSKETYESANAFRKTQLRAEARAAVDLKDAVPAENSLFSKLQTAELKEEGGRRLTDADRFSRGRRPSGRRSASSASRR